MSWMPTQNNGCILSVDLCCDMEVTSDGIVAIRQMLYTKTRVKKEPELMSSSRKETLHSTTATTTRLTIETRRFDRGLGIDEDSLL